MRRAARRGWLLSFAALGIGCVAALAAGEVTVRLAEPRADTPGVPLPGSSRIYGYTANSSGYAGGVPFKTNSLGFRGPDFADVDGATGLVVLVLGDSYAFGYGVQATEAFPALLERQLQQEYRRTDIRVLNLGIPGYDSSQELALLQEWGPKLHPRMVLLQYHLNDIQRHTDGTGAPGGAPHGILAAAREHLHLLRFVLPRIAAAARAMHWSGQTTATAEIDEYVHDGIAWRRNQQVLLQLFDAAHQLGATIGVLVVPYVVQLDDRHLPAPAYDAVVRFCASRGVPAINAFDRFKGRNAGALWINPFDGHPNATGHALLAQAAAELVGKTLPGPGDAP